MLPLYHQHLISYEMWGNPGFLTGRAVIVIIFWREYWILQVKMLRN